MFRNACSRKEHADPPFRSSLLREDYRRFEVYRRMVKDCSLVPGSLNKQVSLQLDSLFLSIPQPEPRTTTGPMETGLPC